MNLDMIRPKNKTEELLLSINKSCETLFTQITQNHEKKEIKLYKPGETFSFKPSISMEGS